MKLPASWKLFLDNFLRQEKVLRIQKSIENPHGNQQNKQVRINHIDYSKYEEFVLSKQE